jgi:hypothetical protein
MLDLAFRAKSRANIQYCMIKGVHIVGPQATESIGEAVVDAARDVEKWSLYLPKK